MSDLKLYYFNMAGRAGPIRDAFNVGKVAFDDVRFGAEGAPTWPAFKSETPAGSVPVLSVGGVTYCQSNSLLRFAGKKAGLYPDDALKALQVDEVMDLVEDAFGTVGPTFSIKDEAEKLAARKALQEDGSKTMKLIGVIEKRFAASENDFLTGSLSVGDLKVKDFVGFVASGNLDGFEKTFFDDKFPTLAKKIKAVEAEVKAKTA